MEAILDSERLKSMVVSGEIENKDNDMGGYRFQKVGGEKSKLAHDLGRFGVNDENLFRDNPNLTAVIFVPLDEFAKGEATKDSAVANQLGIKKKMFGGVTKPWEDGLTAMAYQFMADKLDPSNRTGMIGGTLIFKNEDARQIQDQIQNDPRTLFDLVRAANGGPLKQFNGAITPRQSESITIFPNDKFGGSKKDKTQTAKFPQGYNPNPLM